MAPKKTPVTEEDDLAMPGNSDADIDQAVGDLRGVLQNDADGSLPDVGSDLDSQFGGDFSDASTEASPFDADFGGGDAGSDFGGGDFGGSDFGGADLSDGTAGELGGMGDFGGGDFGGSDFGDSSSAAAAPQPGSALNANLDLIMDIPIDVQIVLGSSRMQVSGLMNLQEGAIIALERKIGEPVEIMVNGRRIARGEITVLENDDTRFGVKLIEVMSTKIH